MKYDPKCIVLDVDGVLLDCEGGFFKVSQMELGRELRRLNNSYDLGKRYGMSSEEASHIWKVMEEHAHGWRAFNILPGVREAVSYLRSQGCSLHLVTSIAEEIRGHRQESLQAHGLEYDSLHCVGAFHGPKTEVIKSLSPIMVVDDRLSNLDGIDEVPYKVFVDHGDEQLGFEPHPDLIRVKSLKEWVDRWKLLIPSPDQNSKRSSYKSI